jgi:hypothetical protein
MFLLFSFRRRALIRVVVGIVWKRLEELEYAFHDLTTRLELEAAAADSQHDDYVVHILFEDLDIANKAGQIVQVNLQADVLLDRERGSELNDELGSRTPKYDLGSELSFVHQEPNLDLYTRLGHNLVVALTAQKRVQMLIQALDLLKPVCHSALLGVLDSMN